MAKKRKYPYYTMNIPNELRRLFEKYIEKNYFLGFKNVSQFILHLCQEEAIEIVRDDPELKAELREEDKSDEKKSKF